MDAGPKFFVVWRESSTPYGHEPTFKHETYESACIEAKRLANKHPNARFLVMHPVIGFSSVAKMEVTLQTVEHKFGPARKAAAEPVQPDGSIDARRWERA